MHDFNPLSTLEVILKLASLGYTLWRAWQDRRNTPPRPRAGHRRTCRAKFGHAQIAQRKRPRRWPPAHTP